MTGQGLREVPLSDDAVGRATLSDDQLFDLARTAKQIEKLFGHPVDIEWLYDDRGLWLLQARPISRLTRSTQLTNDDCEWSRTNFKETMPELPSPLGLSFLELFMERHIVSPYRRLGCQIPEGVSSVRTFQGRPYINMTLFHSLVAQLRGDPSSLMEQMGGEILAKVPEAHPLGWFALARAGVRDDGRDEEGGAQWASLVRGHESDGVRASRRSASDCLRRRHRPAPRCHRAMA